MVFGEVGVDMFSVNFLNMSFFEWVVGENFDLGIGIGVGFIVIIL